MGPKTAPGKERRKAERRAFSDYMQFTNDRTGELLGDLADISRHGFRLEGSKPIPVNAVFPFRVDLPPEISQKLCLILTARSRWSRRHPIDSRIYEAGFEVVHLDPGDSHAFQLIFDRYGTAGARKGSGTDYLWRD